MAREARADTTRIQSYVCIHNSIVLDCSSSKPIPSTPIASLKPALTTLQYSLWGEGDETFLAWFIDVRPPFVKHR